MKFRNEVLEVVGIGLTTDQVDKIRDYIVNEFQPSIDKQKEQLHNKYNDQSYSVWVGSAEVNDYYLTLNDAIELAHEYEDDGYDNVEVRKETNIGDTDEQPKTTSRNV